jgi:hypothetical protein
MSREALIQKLRRIEAGEPAYTVLTEDDVAVSFDGVVRLNGVELTPEQLKAFGGMIIKFNIVDPYPDPSNPDDADFKVETEAQLQKRMNYVMKKNATPPNDFII